jgi:hypothetical protein
MLAIINVEHVLAHGGDLRSIASYRGASILYDAFASQYQVIAMTMANEEIARWWLKRERMPKWARIAAADVLGNNMTTMDYREWQVQQVRATLAASWEIAFYVDTPFGPNEKIHQMGVNTLVVNRTQIIPGWQNPEQGAPRAWDTLVVDSG